MPSQNSLSLKGVTLPSPAFLAPDSWLCDKKTFISAWGVSVISEFQTADPLDVRFVSVVAPDKDVTAVETSRSLGWFIKDRSEPRPSLGGGTMSD